MLNCFILNTKNLKSVKKKGKGKGFVLLVSRTLEVLNFLIHRSIRVPDNSFDRHFTW